MDTLIATRAALLLAAVALPLAPAQLTAQASGPRFINPPGLSRPTGYFDAAHPPANTLIPVSALARPELLLEIEAVVAVPGSAP